VANLRNNLCLYKTGKFDELAYPIDASQPAP
jgi:hypothetical protein